MGASVTSESDEVVGQDCWYAKRADSFIPLGALRAVPSLELKPNLIVNGELLECSLLLW